MNTIETDTEYISQLLTVLRSKYPNPNGLWGYSEDNDLAEDWLLVTPTSVWGKKYEDFKMAVEGDYPDFKLKSCTSDSSGNHLCASVQSTVKAPGGTPQKLMVGHSYRMYEELYKAMISAEKIIDFTTLTPPTGRFLAAFRNAITYISKKERNKRPVIRILYSNPLPNIPPLKVNDFLTEIIRDVENTSAMEIYVGILSSSFFSWNHSKIVAIDGVRSIVGGHNMLGPHYLNSNPVFDVSMKVSGGQAIHCHDYADCLWDFMILKQQPAAQWYWPIGNEKKLYGAYRFDAASGNNKLELGILPSQDIYKCIKSSLLSASTSQSIPILSVGRSADIEFPSYYSYLYYHDEPSDTAMLKLISLGTSKIRMSLQSFQLSSGWVANWNHRLLVELGKALSRGVEVNIVISNPDAVAGGSTSYDGEPPEKINEKMFNVMKNDLNLEEITAKNLINENFKVASLRYSSDETYPGNASIPNHAKTFMVDDRVFYIGSQNQYECNLNEFGHIVESRIKAQEYIDAYWTPLWEQSSRTVVQTYSEDIDKEEGAEATEFILNLNKNKRLNVTWETVLASRTYETDSEKIAEIDDNLSDIIHNAGFVTSVQKVLEILNSPFFTEERTDHLPNEDSDRFVKKLLTDKDLMIEFAEIIDQPMEDVDASVDQFLLSKGYNCNASQVMASFDQLRDHILEYWIGEYDSWINTDGGTSYSNISNVMLNKNTRRLAVTTEEAQTYMGPVLIVSGNLDVSLDGTKIKDPRYSNGVLSWKTDSGNATSASITFGEVTRPALNNSFVGCEFFGTLTYPENGTYPQKGIVSFYGINKNELGPDVDHDLRRRIGYLMTVVGLSSVELTLLAIFVCCRYKCIRRFDRNREERRRNLERDRRDHELKPLVSNSSSEEEHVDQRLNNGEISNKEAETERNGLRKRRKGHDQSKNNSTYTHEIGSWARNLELHEEIRNPDFNSLQDDYRDQVKRLSNDLPWHFCQDEIDRHNGTYTQDEMLQMDDPLAKETQEIVYELNSFDLNISNRNVIDNFSLSSFAGELPELDQKKKEALIGTEITKPMFEKVSDTESGSSYIEDSLRSAVVKQQQHYLEQHAGTIQQKIWESSDTLEKTSTEISAKKETLAEVEKSLEEHPEDPDLQRQKEQLDKEIDDLVEQHKIVEEEYEKAEREQIENEREMEEKREEKEKAGRDKSENANDIFEERI